MDSNPSTSLEVLEDHGGVAKFQKAILPFLVMVSTKIIRLLNYERFLIID